MLAVFLCSLLAVGRSESLLERARRRIMSSVASGSIFSTASTTPLDTSTRRKLYVSSDFVGETTPFAIGVRWESGDASETTKRWGGYDPTTSDPIDSVSEAGHVLVQAASTTATLRIALKDFDESSSFSVTVTVDGSSCSSYIGEFSSPQSLTFLPAHSGDSSYSGISVVVEDSLTFGSITLPTTLDGDVMCYLKIDVVSSQPFSTSSPIYAPLILTATPAVTGFMVGKIGGYAVGSTLNGELYISEGQKDCVLEMGVAQFPSTDLVANPLHPTSSFDFLNSKGAPRFGASYNSRMDLQAFYLGFKEGQPTDQDVTPVTFIFDALSTGPDSMMAALYAPVAVTYVDKPLFTVTISTASGSPATQTFDAVGLLNPTTVVYVDGVNEGSSVTVQVAAVSGVIGAMEASLVPRDDCARAVVQGDATQTFGLAAPSGAATFSILATDDQITNGDIICAFTVTVSPGGGNADVIGTVFVMIEDDDLAAIGLGQDSIVTSGTISLPEGTQCLMPVALLNKPVPGTVVYAQLNTDTNFDRDRFNLMVFGFAFDSYSWGQYQFMNLNSTRTYLQDGDFTLTYNTSLATVLLQNMSYTTLQVPSAVQNSSYRFYNVDVPSVVVMAYDMDGNLLNYNGSQFVYTSASTSPPTVFLREGTYIDLHVGLGTRATSLSPSTSNYGRAGITLTIDPVCTDRIVFFDGTTTKTYIEQEAFDLQDSPRSVRVVALDDEFEKGDRICYLTVANGAATPIDGEAPEYSSSSFNYGFTINVLLEDNDALLPMASGLSTFTVSIPESASCLLPVTLQSHPLDYLTLDMTVSDNTTQVLVENHLFMTTSEWFEPQMVAIKAPSDHTVGGTATALITLGAAAEPYPNALSSYIGDTTQVSLPRNLAESTTVQVIEGDSYGYIVQIWGTAGASAGQQVAEFYGLDLLSGDKGPLTLNDSDTYEVRIRLTTIPSGTVNVAAYFVGCDAVFSDSINGIGLDYSAVPLGPFSNLAGTRTGDQSCSLVITFGPGTGTTDPNYGALSDVSIDTTVVDTDSTGYSITAYVDGSAQGSVTSNDFSESFPITFTEGTSYTITVALNSMNINPVPLTMEISGSPECFGPDQMYTLTGMTLTGAGPTYSLEIPANAQSVSFTLLIPEDDYATSYGTTPVSCFFSLSHDDSVPAEWSSLPYKALDISLQDNDVAGLAFAYYGLPDDGWAREGVQSNVTVCLSSKPRPGAVVQVDPNSGIDWQEYDYYGTAIQYPTNFVPYSGSVFAFDETNWNVPQPLSFSTGLDGRIVNYTGIWVFPMSLVKGTDAVYAEIFSNTLYVELNDGEDVHFTTTSTDKNANNQIFLFERVDGKATTSLSTTVQLTSNFAPYPSLYVVVDLFPIMMDASVIGNSGFIVELAYDGDPSSARNYTTEFTGSFEPVNPGDYLTANFSDASTPVGIVITSYGDNTQVFDFASLLGSTSSSYRVGIGGTPSPDYSTDVEFGKKHDAFGTPKDLFIYFQEQDEARLSIGAVVDGVELFTTEQISNFNVIPALEGQAVTLVFNAETKPRPGAGVSLATSAKSTRLMSTDGSPTLALTAASRIISFHWDVNAPIPQAVNGEDFFPISVGVVSFDDKYMASLVSQVSAYIAIAERQPLVLQSDGSTNITINILEGTTCTLPVGLEYAVDVDNIFSRTQFAFDDLDPPATSDKMAPMPNLLYREESLTQRILLKAVDNNRSEGTVNVHMSSRSAIDPRTSHLYPDILLPMGALLDQFVTLSIEDNDTPGLILTPDILQEGDSAFFVRLKTMPTKPVSLAFAFEWLSVTWGTFTGVLEPKDLVPPKVADYQFDASNWFLDQKVVFSTGLDGRIVDLNVVITVSTTTSDPEYASVSRQLSGIFLNSDKPGITAVISGAPVSALTPVYAFETATDTTKTLEQRQVTLTLTNATQIEPGSSISFDIFPTFLDSVYLISKSPNFRIRMGTVSGLTSGTVVETTASTALSSPAKLRFTFTEASHFATIYLLTGIDDTQVYSYSEAPVTDSKYFYRIALNVTTDGLDLATITDTSYKSLRAQVPAQPWFQEVDLVGASWNVDSFSLAEGGTYTAQIKLVSNPRGTVLLTVVPSQKALVPSPAVVTFTAANWNILQSVTFTSPNDKVAYTNGGSGTLFVGYRTLSSDSISYNATTSDGSSSENNTMSVFYTEDDIAGIRFTNAPAKVGYAVTEGSTSGTAFRLALTSEPQGVVTLTADIKVATTSYGSYSASISPIYTISPSTVTFDKTNYNIPKTFTIRSSKDGFIANFSSSLVLTVSASLDVPYVNLPNTNRTAPFLIVNTERPGLCINNGNDPANCRSTSYIFLSGAESQKADDDGTPITYNASLPYRPSDGVLVSLDLSRPYKYIDLERTFTGSLFFDSNNFQELQPWKIHLNQTAVAELSASAIDRDILYFTISSPDNNYQSFTKIVYVEVSTSSLTITQNTNDILNNLPPGATYAEIKNDFGITIKIPAADLSEFNPAIDLEVAPISPSSIPSNLKPDEEFAAFDFVFTLKPHGTLFELPIEICMPLSLDSFPTLDGLRIFKAADEASPMKVMTISNVTETPTRTACFTSNSFSVVGLASSTSDVTLNDPPDNDLKFLENADPLLFCDGDPSTSTPPCSFSSAAGTSASTGILYAMVTIPTGCDSGNVARNELGDLLTLTGYSGGLTYTDGNCSQVMYIYNATGSAGGATPYATATPMSLDELTAAIDVLSFTTLSDNPNTTDSKDIVLKVYEDIYVSRTITLTSRLTVIARDDPPRYPGCPTTVGFTEKDKAKSLFPPPTSGCSIFDPDSTDFAGVTLTIDYFQPIDQVVLDTTIMTAAGISNITTVDAVNHQLVVALTGVAPIGTYTSLLQSSSLPLFTFENDGPVPGGPTDPTITDPTQQPVYFRNVSFAIVSVSLSADPNTVSSYQYQMRLLSVNDPPVIVANIPTFTYDEGAGLQTVNLTQYASDPEGDPLTYKIICQPSFSTVTSPNTQNDGILTLLPIKYENGNDQILFQALDNKGGKSNFGVLSIAVNPVPSAPDRVSTLPTDCAFQAEYGAVFNADGSSTPAATTIYSMYSCVYDPDTDKASPKKPSQNPTGLVSFTITSVASLQGTLHVYSGSTVTNVTALTPVPVTFTDSTIKYDAPDSPATNIETKFTFTASNAQGPSIPFDITITYIEAGASSNIAPTGHNVTVVLTESDGEDGIQYLFDLNKYEFANNTGIKFFTDNPQVNPYTFEWSNVNGGENFNFGTLTPQPTAGQYLYKPTPFASGTDVFRWRVTDQFNLQSNYTYLTIVILNKNQPPRAACMEPTSFLGIDGYDAAQLDPPVVLALGPSDFAEPGFYDGGVSDVFRLYWRPRVYNNIVGDGTTAVLDADENQPNGQGGLELYRVLLKTSVLLPDPTTYFGLATVRGDPYVACNNTFTVPVPMTKGSGEGAVVAGNEGVIVALYGYDVDETDSLGYFIESVPDPFVEGTLYYLQPNAVKDYLTARLQVGDQYPPTTPSLANIETLQNLFKDSNFVRVTGPNFNLTMGAAEVGNFNITQENNSPLDALFQNYQTRYLSYRNKTFLLPMLVKFVPAADRRGLPLWSLKWSLVDSLGARSDTYEVNFNVRCYPGFRTSGQNSSDTAPGDCIACPPGQYNADKTRGLSAYDQSECLMCDKGTYQNATGSTSCLVSPINAFVPVEGSAVYYNCPDPQMVSEERSTQIDDCKCRTGTFINGTSIFNRKCTPCNLALTICDRRNQLFPLPRQEGIYVDPLNGANAQTCPLIKACPQWTNYTDVLDGRCARGYAKFQCAACAEGFYRSNGNCKRCNSNAYVLYVIAGLVLIIVIPILFKLAQFDVFASINILIAYLQALSVFRQFEFQWPPEILRIFNFMSIFNIQIDLVAPECVNKKWNYINKIWIAYIIPIGYFTLFLVFYVYKRWRRELTLKQVEREKSLGLHEVLTERARRGGSMIPSEPSSLTQGSRKRSHTVPLSPPGSPPHEQDPPGGDDQQAGPSDGVPPPKTRKKSIRFADTQSDEEGSKTEEPGPDRSRSAKARRGNSILDTGAERTPSELSVAYTVAESEDAVSFYGTERSRPPSDDGAGIKEFDWEDEELKRKKRRPTEVGALFRTDERFRRGIAGFLVFLSWAYFMIATATSEYYNCKKNQSNGAFYMEKDASVQCWNFKTPNLHTYLLPASIAAVVFYIIGIPALFGTLLFSQTYWLTRRKKILASRTTIGSSKYSERDLKNIFALEQTMGFLFKRYRSNAFWWELLVLGRKLVFSVMVFLGQVEKILVITIVCVVYIGGLFLVQPYSDRHLTYMDMTAIACNTLLIYSGYFFYSDIISVYETKVLTVCIVILIIGSVIVLGIFVLYDLFPKLRLVLRKTRIEKNKKVLRRNHLLIAKRYLARMAGQDIERTRIRGISQKDVVQHMANVEDFIHKRVRVWYTKLRVVAFFMIPPRKKFTLLAFKRILKPKMMDKFRHWLLREATDAEFEEAYYVATKLHDAMARMPALQDPNGLVEVRVKEEDESIETLKQLKRLLTRKKKGFERPPEIMPRQPEERRYRAQGLIAPRIAGQVLEAAAFHLKETHRNAINQHLEAMNRYTLQVNEDAFRDLMFEDGAKPRFLYDPENVNEPDESWLPKIRFTRRQGLDVTHFRLLGSRSMAGGGSRRTSNKFSHASAGGPGSARVSGRQPSSAQALLESMALAPQSSVGLPFATGAGLRNSTQKTPGSARAAHGKSAGSKSFGRGMDEDDAEAAPPGELYPSFPTYGGGLPPEVLAMLAMQTDRLPPYTEDPHAAYPTIQVGARGEFEEIGAFRSAQLDVGEVVSSPTVPRGISGIRTSPVPGPQAAAQPVSASASSAARIARIRALNEELVPGVPLTKSMTDRLKAIEDERDGAAPGQGAAVGAGAASLRSVVLTDLELEEADQEQGAGPSVL